jgi:hypothetical protein
MQFFQKKKKKKHDGIGLDVRGKKVKCGGPGYAIVNDYILQHIPQQ